MNSADPQVLEACRQELARGSKSFAAASRLLPSRLRDPVAAFYAFCRVSDDAVDESDNPKAALAALEKRLDKIMAGTPSSHPADRGLSWVVTSHDLPRAPLDALLEGYAWDVEGRRYRTVAELRGYCARVASSVGVFMTRLMGVRDPAVLARAADLGVAMQLTNIARDVGEDARAGRLYLPTEDLVHEGIDPDAWLADPRFDSRVGVVVCRLLDHAEGLYRRSERGVPYLPKDCRLAIAAARYIYADIGRVIRAQGYNSVCARAFTTSARKAVLFSRAVPARFARPSPLREPPLPEVAFLLES
ncbi:MAG: phytoene/squalene synthase family protein [Sandaracinaceae bacterium]